MVLEEKIKRSEVIYLDMFENCSLEYDEYITRGKSVEDWEDIQVGFREWTFAIYDVDRILCFIGMAYIEIMHNTFSERLRGEIEMDLPLWESGEIEKHLRGKKEKEAVHEHYKVVKEYMDKTNQE